MLKITDWFSCSANDKKTPNDIHVSFHHQSEGVYNQIIKQDICVGYENTIKMVEDNSKEW